MSHNPRRRPHEGVIIDDIAEERARLAKLQEEDFPGTRNIPSTGLKPQQGTQKLESKTVSHTNEQKTEAPGRHKKP
ncbi:hypothetical protein M408DRAFT_328610, partial [Serendipita vermifera MAFF 305830]